MATKTILLKITGDASGASKAVSTLTTKVNSLTAALNKAATASARQQTQAAKAAAGGGGLMRGGLLGNLTAGIETGQKKIDAAIKGIDSKVKRVTQTLNRNL